MNRKPIRILLPVVVVLAAAVWLLLLRSDKKPAALFLSGTVEATEAQLGFPAGGRVTEILVREGERSEAGAVLARLDPAEMSARRDQALAQAAAARALLQEIEGGSRPEELAQARAAREAARQRLQDAERDLRRTRDLRAAGAVSQEALDKAALAHDLARSQFTQADEQARLAEIGPRIERIEAQRAQLAQAVAAVAALEAQLENMVIRAPFSGVVTVRHREPGEIVPPGSAVITLMNPNDRWVRVYLPETRIGKVRLGQQAKITTDTDPHRSTPGEVTFIASEAEFTPKSVQTKEERVKLVYAVKVRVTGDPQMDLKPGMPADVTLDIDGW
ncbi:MAG: HlyD family efflux transporter periplasmic adaptor subunit [Candidatus Eisenbacteria bacterium]|nr:HlyD family efflux transporter periplasmic adaptor subunit [Candidatus Eisenbacteria bacterium]